MAEMVDIGVTGDKPDNRITYELYPSVEPNDDILAKYQNILSELTKCDSISFDLKISPKKKSIRGSHRFDFNIDEEWFIVYCLYELSKKDSDVVIRVSDNDGEILLIEAADHLPRWLESKDSKNRVYIHKGKVHIVPKNIDVKNVTKDKIATMVRCSSMQAGDRVQRAISDQLSGLPDRETWLQKKFTQLDEIISSNSKQETEEDGPTIKPFDRANLSLASVMAMDEEDLEISPISSLSSSPS